MPVKQISARLEVLAVGEIRVIYAFPVADEDITDNAEVKYEEHLCLHTCQDFLGVFFLFFFSLLERLPGFPLGATPCRSSVMQPYESLKRSLHAQMWGVRTICVF